MPSWLCFCAKDGCVQYTIYLLDQNKWITGNGRGTELPVTAAAAAAWVQSVGQGASLGGCALGDGGGGGGGGLRAATEGQTVAC